MAARPIDDASEPGGHPARAAACGLRIVLPAPGAPIAGHRWFDRGGRDGDATDALFPHPRTGALISIRGLFALLREEGVEPHPLGEARDGEMVLAFQRAQSRFAALDLDGGTIHLPDLGHLGERRAAVRSRWLGVDRARVPYPDRDAGETTDGAGYGYLSDVFADIAELHGGSFREGLHSDLTWNHVFLDTEIPKPGEILDLLRTGSYAALSRFLISTLFARASDIQLFPTIFVRGGGEGLNPDTHAASDFVEDPVTDVRADGAPRYDTVRAGRTRHHASAILASPLGWDAWYYDPTTLGLEPPLSDFTTSSRVREDGTVDPGEPDDGTYVETNQRFSVNVYNSVDGDPDTPEAATNYLGLVALRKSMALAAFGQGLGEFLRRVDGALQRAGFDLADTVPHLELGAENDAQWALTTEFMPDADTLSVPQAANLRTYPYFRESAHEYARFHAILAATIRQEWPAARFKASEVASWASHREAAARPAWLGFALAEQLPVQTSFIRAVSRRDTSVPGVQDWLDQQADAGYELPALSVATTSLLQVVGFHWFHFWLYVNATNPGYQNEAEMYTDTVYPFLALVVDACTLAHFHVQWGVGNFGFPSGEIVEDAQGGGHAPAYEANSQELEAGHLVRGLLTLVGYGANHVLWFSHMGEKEGPAAGEFATMGLRNDEPVAPDPDGDIIVPDASADAWPKAAWYAFQRLALLLSRASSVEVVYNTGGLVVLRLVRGVLGLANPSGGGKTWQYGYVFWIDGASPSTTFTSATLRFTMGGHLAVAQPFERVALVPAATDFEDFAPSGSAYALSSNPDWADSDPNANPDFGHATQHWAALTLIPSDWEPNPDPYTVSVPPHYVELIVDLLPTNKDNFGIVVWLMDAPNVEVIA